MRNVIEKQKELRRGVGWWLTSEERLFEIRIYEIISVAKRILLVGEGEIIYKSNFGIREFNTTFC